MDGKIVIGTEIDTSGIDRGIKAVERKINRLVEKKDSTIELESGAKVTGLSNLTENEERYLAKLYSTYAKLLSQKTEMEKKSRQITQETINQTTEIQKQTNEINAQNQKKTIKSVAELPDSADIKQYEELYDDLEKSLNELKSIQGQKIISDVDLEDAEELKEHIRDLVDEIEKITGERIEIKGITDIDDSVSNAKMELSKLGNVLERNINKAKTLILGIFGIRGAYMAVRNAINIISSDDQQMKADIDYIKNVLAYALEPIVRTIVDWVKILVSYIGYLAKAWFNYDIFAKATEKSLSSSVGSAKELRKQLAGFDEMNVLQDQSSSGGGGGGGALPDFGSFQLDNPPKWLEWIANNGDLVKVILEGIASAILAIKYGLGLIEGLGIFLIIDSTLRFIEDLQRYLEYPTWERFLAMVIDALNFIGGIFLFINPMVSGIAILLSIISAIVIELDALVKLLSVDNYEDALIIFKEMIDNMGIWGDMLKWILQLFGMWDPAIDEVVVSEEDLIRTEQSLIDMQNQEISAVDREAQTLKNLQQAQEETGISIEELLKTMNDQGLKYKDLDENQKRVYKEYIRHEQAQEDLNKVEEKLNQTTEKTTDKTKSYGKEMATAFDKGSKGSKLAKDTINPNINDINTTAENTFKKNIPNMIASAFNSDNYSNNIWGLVGSINNILGNINPIKLGVSAVGGIAHLFGYAKGGIVVPKLASGGIINNPGRGVPIGQAIGGEHGMEGVIPLTDSQQMELLGSAIGRYITINANITNTMNGKVISRELQRIQNDEDFAMNR